MMIKTGMLMVLLLVSCTREASRVESETSGSSKSSKALSLVRTLEAEVNNGGFDQFFFNSSGEWTEETVVALKNIGAAHTAEIVTRAASKFPGGMPPKDRDKRCEVLLSISPNAAAFEKEDEAFYEYKDDLSALLKEYKEAD